MLISEATVKRNRAGQRTQSLRAVVANACLIAGTTGMILCVLLLSSALLPPLGVMLALAVVLAVVAWLQWRFLVRIYARAQIAIKETLESHELGQAESEADALPTDQQYYEKFSFRYCSTACLGAHRRAGFVEPFSCPPPPR